MVSLTPSVTLVVDFDGRNDMDEEKKMISFYRGSAHVSLKDSIFQPSNAERHAVELISLLQAVSGGGSVPSPVLFVMTDGGPDHNCKHLSVQMSWLGFFFKTRMDMLVVTRVAPTQIWTNPAERCMGPINPALQNCDLSRAKFKDDEMEVHMRRCNGMSSVRKKADNFTVNGAATSEVGAYLITRRHPVSLITPSLSSWTRTLA